MLLFAQTCEAVGGTPRKSEKVRIVADYLKARSLTEASVAALFFSGRVFPQYTETTLQVGGSLLWQAMKAITGASDTALTAAYRKRGDSGAAAYDLLIKHELEKVGPRHSELTLLDAERRFREIAEARGAAPKLALVTDLLTRAVALEAKYLIKLMTGELRIGLRESLVEEAIAQAFGDNIVDDKNVAKSEIKKVQRANMLLGDIGETLRLAAGRALDQARMRLFHPIGFMLATPAQSAEEAFEEFQHAAVEDKYDGIRAQAHCGRGENGEPRVRLFSRTLDDVTESFPELVPALQAFTGDVILDGEIVGWSPDSDDEASHPAGVHPAGHALPFFDLQKRLGRKRVTAAMMRAVPVAYVAFDVLYAGNELAIDRPLRERAVLLDAMFAGAGAVKPLPVAVPQGKLVFAPEGESGESGSVQEAEPLGRVLRAPVQRADSAQQLDEMFAAAQARGNEGLMIKDLESLYTPGRRGRTWLKLKRELATLDVVVTAAEYGHGKRVGVLSDYTFAVRSADRLLNVGKAYSGLTDAEIAGLTTWFIAHTVEDRGFVRLVEPKIVLEVAFNAVMRSDRHASGFALRFPRILRIRNDKPAEEIDTLERVEEIHRRQGLQSG